MGRDKANCVTGVLTCLCIPNKNCKPPFPHNNSRPYHQQFQPSFLNRKYVNAKTQFTYFSADVSGRKN